MTFKVQVPNNPERSEWRLHGQVISITLPITDPVSTYNPCVHLTPIAPVFTLTPIAPVFTLTPIAPVFILTHIAHVFTLTPIVPVFTLTPVIPIAPFCILPINFLSPYWGGGGLKSPLPSISTNFSKSPLPKNHQTSAHCTPKDLTL